MIENIVGEPTRNLELRGTLEDRWWIYAVMLFPENRTLRDQFFTHKQVEAKLLGCGDKDILEIDARTLATLIDTPSKSELAKLVAEATKRAVSAGDILASIYLMDLMSKTDSRFKRPSLRKALHISMKFALDAKFGDGEALYRSKSKLEKCLDEYRSVAHFWAAFRLSQAFQLPNLRPGEPVLCSNSFLEVAAGMHDFGTTYALTGNRGEAHVIDISTTWKLPPSVAKTRLTRAHLPDRLLEYLASYEAPTV